MPSQISILKSENRRLREELSQAKKDLTDMELKACSELHAVQNECIEKTAAAIELQEAASCWAATLKHFGPAKHDWLLKVIFSNRRAAGVNNTEAAT